MTSQMIRTRCTVLYCSCTVWELLAQQHKIFYCSCCSILLCSISSLFYPSITGGVYHSSHLGTRAHLLYPLSSTSVLLLPFPLFWLVLSLCSHWSICFAFLAHHITLPDSHAWVVCVEDSVISWSMGQYLYGVVLLMLFH